MIISISGPAGSGKSTVGKIVAKRLGYNYYSVGDLRRKMANERGMTLEEFNKIGENDVSTDKLADDYQVELSKKENNFIMEGRLAWYFIPSSVKILITADNKVCAERIFNDSVRKHQQKVDNLEDQLRLCIERDNSDIMRYQKWYNIQNFLDTKNYDLIIDTSHETNTEKIADSIMDYLKSKKYV